MSLVGSFILHSDSSKVLPPQTICWGSFPPQQTPLPPTSLKSLRLPVADFLTSLQMHQLVHSAPLLFLQRKDVTPAHREFLTLFLLILLLSLSLSWVSTSSSPSPGFFLFTFKHISPSNEKDKIFLSKEHHLSVLHSQAAQKYPYLPSCLSSSSSHATEIKSPSASTKLSVTELTDLMNPSQSSSHYSVAADVMHTSLRQGAAPFASEMSAPSHSPSLMIFFSLHYGLLFFYPLT